MSDTARRPAAWHTRVALLAATLVLVLLLGEIGARLVDRVGAREAPTRAPRAQTSVEEKAVFEDLLEISRPNLDGVHNGVPFRTNSQGVRGPEIEARSRPGVTRILFVGDSVTMGAGVLEEEAYAMQLAGLTERRIESINGGLSGLNAKAVMDRLERLDTAYSPRLIVYGFTINDIEGPAYDTGDDPAAVARLWAKAARFRDSPSALVRHLWPRWVMLQERLAPTLGVGPDPFVRNYLENPRAFAAIETALDRLALRASEGDRCAAVLIHTHLKDLDERAHVYLPVYDRVEAAARARGLHPIPTYGFFANRRVAPLWVSFLDPHPSREGHALLAAALAAGLEALPHACWSPRD